MALGVYWPAIGHHVRGTGGRLLPVFFVFRTAGAYPARQCRLRLIRAADCLRADAEGRMALTQHDEDSSLQHATIACGGRAADLNSMRFFCQAVGSSDRGMRTSAVVGAVSTGGRVQWGRLRLQYHPQLQF